jgi:iron-sulfur cluster assembly protein
VGRYTVESATTAVWRPELLKRAILSEDPESVGCRNAVATLNEVSETPTAAITLTDKAAEKIGELLGGQAETGEQALRVAVRGGGCSGFQYALAFDRAKEDDNVFEVDGVSVVVDKVSMQFVFGSEVDYIEGLQGAGFQVNNPNVVAACGCGSSFQVKEDAAEGVVA